MEVKAIETEYGGYKFRSRLEARWAVFFDTANIKYEYETEGFELEDNTKYLPDFYLPEYDWYVEVKPPRENAAEDLKRAIKFVGDKIKALLILPNIPQKKDVDLWHYAVAYYDVIAKKVMFTRVCFAPCNDNELKFNNQNFVDLRSRGYADSILKKDINSILNALHDSDVQLYEYYAKFDGIMTEKGEQLYLKKSYSRCETLDENEIKMLAKCYDTARQARFEHSGTSLLNCNRELSNTYFEKNEIPDSIIRYTCGGQKMYLDYNVFQALGYLFNHTTCVTEEILIILEKAKTQTDFSLYIDALAESYTTGRNLEECLPHFVYEEYLRIRSKSKAKTRQSFWGHLNYIKRCCE